MSTQDDNDPKLEGFPKYNFGDVIQGVEKHYPDGRLLVRLPDGSHAMAVPMQAIKKDRDCSPKSFREWREKLAASNPDDPRITFMDRMLEDSRTQSFWCWLSTLNPNWWRNVSTITDYLIRAARLPQKPGNFSPKQREAYFLEVRGLANRLHALLTETRFDHTTEREMTDEELNKPIGKHLYSWGDDESDEGHVVAYRVDSDGVYELDYDFPDCELTATLRRLVEWTYWDDYWGRSIFHSSAPIRQSNSKGVRVQYFNCSVWQWFHDHGAEIPYAVLASICEVILALEAGETLDEDTVKKQVLRYRQRVNKPHSLHTPPEGQISMDGEDFVLQTPF